MNSYTPIPDTPVDRPTAKSFSECPLLWVDSKSSSYEIREDDDYWILRFKPLGHLTTLRNSTRPEDYIDYFKSYINQLCLIYKDQIEVIRRYKHHELISSKIMRTQAQSEIKMEGFEVETKVKMISEKYKQQIHHKSILFHIIRKISEYPEDVDTLVFDLIRNRNLMDDVFCLVNGNKIEMGEFQEYMDDMNLIMQEYSETKYHKYFYADEKEILIVCKSLTKIVDEVNVTYAGIGGMCKMLGKLLKSITQDIIGEFRLLSSSEDKTLLLQKFNMVNFMLFVWATEYKRVPLEHCADREVKNDGVISYVNKRTIKMARIVKDIAIMFKVCELRSSFRMRQDKREEQQMIRSQNLTNCEKFLDIIEKFYKLILLIIVMIGVVTVVSLKII
jgi:hypothetical protein